MPATARKIPVSAEDLAGNGGGGAYTELEVPADYEMILRGVEDYDKTAKGKGKGWIFSYGVETPSGKEVSFDIYCSFSQAARWKLIEVLEAHGADLSEGLNEVDPNEYVDDVVGGHIDFPRDSDDQPTSAFREVRSVFSLASLPEKEPYFGETQGEDLQAEEVEVI